MEQVFLLVEEKKICEDYQWGKVEKLKNIKSKKRLKGVPQID